ncbi:MAG: hypothetical protein U0230_10485 [Polyangiales bacterium]
MSRHERSLALVAEARRALPDALARTLAVALPERPSDLARVVTTGIGASEGPARLLAQLLVENGLAARFHAASRFGGDTPHGDLLVVFSQGLSPNVLGALRCGERFRHVWLVTGLDAETDATARAKLAPARAVSARSIVVPGADPPGTLVRWIGPTTASLLAFRLAARLLDDRAMHERLERAPAAYAKGRALGVIAPGTAVSLVVVDQAVECAYAHRWKLLEGLLLPDPPVWDVLQVAHGPLQSFYEREMTLLVLERGHGSLLVERLRRVLDPTRHRLWHLATEHADECAFFEQTGTLDATLFASLEAHPRDHFDWPGRDRDAPLYDFGRAPAPDPGGAE